MSKVDQIPDINRDFRDIFARLDALEKKSSGPRFYGPFESAAVSIGVGATSSMVISHADIDVAADSYLVLHCVRGVGNGGCGVTVTSRAGISTTLSVTNASGVGLTGVVTSIYVLA